MGNVFTPLCVQECFILQGISFNIFLKRPARCLWRCTARTDMNRGNLLNKVGFFKRMYFAQGVTTFPCVFRRLVSKCPNVKHVDSTQPHASQTKSPHSPSKRIGCLEQVCILKAGQNQADTRRTSRPFTSGLRGCEMWTAARNTTRQHGVHREVQT